jgi:NAD(P)-dependent dehydrogenase (short-subunit alcohol dehydrogenase family)
MKNMNKIASVLLITVSVFIASRTTLAAPGDGQKAVLVTGASSGIGLRTTEVLSANGFYVYAGARSPEDLERLDAMDNVSSVKLDVTIQEDVDKAFDFVEAQGRGLWGVVNNAGVVEYSSLVEGPLSGVEFTFDVNVYGPIRVNIAFLPLLDESRGRTVTISSIAGFLAGRSGSYTMSKFAVEGYTDSLARELAGSGVHVSAVEPGGYRSKIQENRVERLLERAERGEIHLGEERRAELLASLTDVESMKEPYEVAEAILDIMSSSKPKSRYLVTPNEQQAGMTIRGAMKRMLQLNEDHRYSFDRDELVAMLDELLAE